MDSFETFWSAYPRRIAKAEARRAFDKAMRKTTLETILSALESYKKHKPEYADFCHPATWLNGERWADEWEPPKTIVPTPLFRPARNVDELRQYLQSIGKPVSAEIARARDVTDLPAFARMVPADWQPSNVTHIRKAG